MRTTIKTNATDLIIDIDFFKQHCRIDLDDDDSLITAYLKSAQDLIENRINRAIGDNSYILTIDNFNDTPIYLDFANPNLSNVVIKYYDTDGNSQTLNSSNYKVINGFKPFIVKSINGTFPDVQQYEGSVQIEYDAGFTDDIPENLKLAIMLLGVSYYENREDVSFQTSLPKTLPLGADLLLQSYRISEVYGG